MRTEQTHPTTEAPTRPRPASARPAGSGGAVARRAAIARRATTVAAAAVARRSVASLRRDPELSARWEARTAADVAHALGDLRGAIMKIGQMLSYVDHRVPESLRTALVALREDAPKLAPELSAAVVEDELGRPPDVVFARWDPEPFAAASIGQVHHAVTHDGREVAVKVQFPGVDVAVRSDLGAVKLLLLPLRASAPGWDMDAIATELRERICEELDYRREAANQRLFGEIYRGHPHIVIPEVHDELSTGRVLTTDLVGGHRVADARRWPRSERDMAGETIYRFAAGALHDLDVVHGDLHPGNLRLLGDGRVAVLDFGLVRHVDAEHRAQLVHLFELWDRGAHAELAEAMGALGYFGSNRRHDPSSVAEFFGSFFPLLHGDADLTVTPEVATQALENHLAPRFDELRASWCLPGSMLFLHRANLGAHAILGELEATAPWRTISRESWSWDQRPAPGPLAEAHRRWQAARGEDDGSQDG